VNATHVASFLGAKMIVFMACDARFKREVDQRCRKERESEQQCDAVSCRMLNYALANATITTNDVMMALIVEKRLLC